MPKFKLLPEDEKIVIDTLNGPPKRTITDAARELKCTRQTLRTYMNAMSIDFVGEYRKTVRTIDAPTPTSPETKNARGVTRA